MKVFCVNDVISNKNSPQSIIEWSNNTQLEITIGKIYTVFAITKYFDILFYYILSDESNEYPLAYPFYLFKICDKSISRFWQTSLSKIQKIEDIDIANGEIISFKEWSLNKDRFYENLLDGNTSEVNIFNKYRDQMLVE